MELPSLSLCMPVSGRREFKRLIISNLHRLDYPKNKIEFIIDCDGTDEERKNNIILNDEELQNFKLAVSPIDVTYKLYEGKKSIGEKRNRCVKLAKHKIIAFLDSDDYYLENYLKHSINLLKEKNLGLVGSNQMIFLFAPKNFEDKWMLTGIQCKDKRMIHEACMVFTKKHWKAMGGFQKNSQGEGTAMIDNMNEKTIGLTSIENIMVCITHPGNTITKERFRESEKIDGYLNEFDKKLIHKILYP